MIKIPLNMPLWNEVVELTTDMRISPQQFCLLAIASFTEEWARKRWPERYLVPPIQSTEQMVEEAFESGKITEQERNEYLRLTEKDHQDNMKMPGVWGDD